MKKTIFPVAYITIFTVAVLLTNSLFEKTSSLLMWFFPEVQTTLDGRGSSAVPASATSTYFPVGPGEVDVIPHQIVRTNTDHLYLFAYQDGTKVLRVYRTTGTGLPTSAADFASTQVTDASNILGVDAIYDGANFIHVLVNTQDRHIRDYPFDVTTNTFKSAVTLASDGGAVTSGLYAGTSGAAGMMDLSGHLHVVYWTSTNHILHRVYSYNGSTNTLTALTSFSQIDTAGNANHPALAISPVDNSLTVAWISQADNPVRIRTRSRASNGTWGSIQVASTASVWTSTSWGINIDQGPSLIIDSAGVKHMTYIQSAYSNVDYGQIHYITNTGSAWVDHTLNAFTHDPALAINSAGEIYIIGHGHPNNPTCLSMNDMCIIKKNSDGTWGTPQLFATPPSDTFDSSPSVKWSVLGFNRPEAIEFLFFKTPYNATTLYYGRLEFKVSVNVAIGSNSMGSYTMQPSSSLRVSYAGVDSGPVQVVSNGSPIVASLRDLWSDGTNPSSSVQVMGLPAGQLSSTYVFPAYNNVSLDDQLRIGNVGTATTTVTVTIGGVYKGSYSLNPSQSVRVNYPGVDSGPVVVQSSGNVPIIASIRDSWWDGTAWSSYSQLMGLPGKLLSSTYVFPAYNNVSLDDQLRIGNVGTAKTKVTVTIGGVYKGSYDLNPSQSMRVYYPGVDGGPVVVQSSGNVPIIASIRDSWKDGNDKWSSYFQLMGLPGSLLSNTYVFPVYDNVNVDAQLRVGNVGTASTTVTVTIAGVVKGTYSLAPNQSFRAYYAGVNAGPMVVQSSGNIPIIASIRDSLWDGSTWSSYSQLMGLPGSQLSSTYVFPAYNNVSYDNELRVAVP